MGGRVRKEEMIRKEGREVMKDGRKEGRTQGKIWIEGRKDMEGEGRKYMEGEGRKDMEEG